jgi:hypothetical protein
MEKKPMRLLIMNENYEDYLITSSYIHQIPTQKYHTYWCSDYHQVMDSMLNNLYDAYLIDYHISGKKSTDYLVEAIIEECEEPVVLLSNNVRATLNKGFQSSKVLNQLIKSELNSEKLEYGIRSAVEQSLLSKQVKAEGFQYQY